MVYDIGIVRRRRVIQQGDAFFNNVVPSVSYVGPGDVVPGAAAWWGLRAYTSASIGSNAVRLREDGGNTEQDFPTIAGGGLNLASIASFKGANNLFVTKLYDQSGNGRDASQSTAGQQPAFTLAGMGSLPIITFSAASLQYFSIASYTRGTTVSYSTVMQPTDVANPHAMFGSQNIGGGTPTLEFRINASKLDVLAQQQALLGSGATTLVNGTTYALGAFYDGTNWGIFLNGTSDGSGINTHGIVPVSNAELAAADTASEFANGVEQEWGEWASVLTDPQMAGLSSNQRAYWGF